MPPPGPQGPERGQSPRPQQQQKSVPHSAPLRHCGSHPDGNLPAEAQGRRGAEGLSSAHTPFVSPRSDDAVEVVVTRPALCGLSHGFVPVGAVRVALVPFPEVPAFPVRVLHVFPHRRAHVADECDAASHDPTPANVGLFGGSMWQRTVLGADARNFAMAASMRSQKSIATPAVM